MSKEVTDMSFSEAYKELQTISSNLQKETDDLDGLLDQVRTASKLIQHCKTKLQEAETELKSILGEVEEATDEVATIEEIEKNVSDDDNLPF